MRKLLFSVILSLSFLHGGTWENRCCDVGNVGKYLKARKAERWEALVWALCEEESGNNDRARNPKSSAYGRFQMLKVYVDECNRIVGRKKYRYADRGNYEKAREMFELYQGHHNPGRDIDKAILIHICITLQPIQEQKTGLIPFCRKLPVSAIRTSGGMICVIIREPVWL